MSVFLLMHVFHGKTWNRTRIDGIDVFAYLQMVLCFEGRPSTKYRANADEAGAPARVSTLLCLPIHVVTTRSVTLDHFSHDRHHNHDSQHPAVYCHAGAAPSATVAASVSA